METYKNELSKSPLSQAKVVFYLNKFVSNFGQSYLKPVTWILVMSVIYYMLILGYENHLLYRVHPPANGIIASVSSFFNDLAKNFLPLKKLLKPGMEFVSVIFYVIFASLTWQTIIAIKRHTKR